MKHNNKKITIGALATVVALSVGVISAFAASPRYGRNFIDKDNNGICDNYSANSCLKNGCGRNFADVDGDGVCDN